MADHIQDRLDAYLEEMLDSGTQAAFDLHVGKCGSCRRAVKAAREVRQCLNWLVPAEAPPVPGPEFYARVEQSIGRRLSRNWFDALGAAMRPRLAYPLLFLGLLTAAWTFTSDIREPEEGMTEIEYPSAEFAQMSYTTADHDLSEDLVMMNLVELPERPIELSQ